MENREWRVENGEYGKLCAFASLRLCVDVAQGHVAASLRLVAGGVFFAQALGLDDDVRHGGKLRLGNWTGLTRLTGLYQQLVARDMSLRLFASS